MNQSNSTEPASVAEDPLAICVKIDPAIHFSARGKGTETTYVANDTRTGKFFRFGAREYHAANLMDGSRTLGEISEQLQKDAVLWSSADVLNFARELVQHKLASVQADQSVAPATTNEAPQGPAPNAAKPKGMQRAVGLMSKLLSQRFAIADGDRLASRLLRTFGFVFHPAATSAFLFLIFSGIGLVWNHYDAFGLEIKRIFDRGLWLWMGALWCVLKLVHECGHAVCAKRLGVRVGKMGVMFFLFAPLAYVDVTDAWKLHRRRDRVQIALAGVYVELIIGALAAWVWYFSPTGMAKHFAAHVFLIAGPATLLVNANPLLRLDGYYVFSDLLEIPNLREHGRKRLVQLIERVLFGLPMPECRLSGWRRDVAVIHAFCSVIFQVIWMTGLIVAVSSWAKGLGLGIAVVAGLLWAAIPLIRWMCKIWTTEKRSGWFLTFYQRRLLTLCSLACVLVHTLMVNASPFSRRVPVVVRYHNEQIERAPVGAFVTGVYVRCGQRVERGKLLVELEQPELIVKRNQLSDQYDVTSRKVIQHRRRGDVALMDAAIEKSESLLRQIEELDDQIASLRIVADRSGQVTSSAVDKLLGSFVQQGDEIVRVSDPQEKEILAVVAEDNMQAYRKAVESSDVATIRLRGGVRFEAPLASLQPAASRSLPHRALAASNGGPLAIQPASNSEQVLLVQPQLQAVIPLDVMTSMSIQSGQVGRLTIPDDRSLIARLTDYLAEKR
ncbi:efflux RND transporter periplasmic adaptor subunit [Stieleria sp. JC731]|uniref:site-2 protease family protein n=1 Tax=Pirellulaceae TaxID=2691357 RepID=UPI001E5BEB82|nr:site-2 protease family protein [Stieleria sp. JC731]MCC9603143.1 efflux RND transporter periplasmic adaptor subunit [Stieleria sp. JC731]